MKANIWTWGALVVVLLGGWYWYHSSHTTPKAVQYITASAQKGMITASVSGSGNVIVDQSATVDPTITGTVTGLSVNVGDAVKKGQSLFGIVNDQLSVDVAKASASNMQSQNAIDSALLSRKQARVDYDNAKKKDHKDGSAYTRDELALLKQKVNIADLNTNAVMQSATASRLAYYKTASDAKKRIVVSPIDGTVNEINIKNGDDLAKISSGSSKVSPMIIGDLTTLEAKVLVNEVDIANIAVGQKAMISFSALNDLTVTGKVKKIDSLGTISQGVVSYTVVLSFDSLDARIKPNMSVSASIVYDAKSGVVTVSNSALKSDAEGSFVEVLVGGAPQTMRVETGLSNATDTEITRGIHEGDDVVTQTIDPNATTSSSSSSGLRIPGISGGRG